MIFTVDNIIKINYPLNIQEDGIQNIITSIKKLDLNNKTIDLETEDIAISLVFFFRELLNNEDLNITLKVRKKVYNMLVKNFGEIFTSLNLKVSDE